MFAVSIKLRVECLFWIAMAGMSLMAMKMPLKDRYLAHAMQAPFGLAIMCIDFNHWLPGSLNVPFPFGHNNFVTGIGRFIGWSFGAVWVGLNLCSLIALYHARTGYMKSA
jgi:hypothetical protein